MAITRQSGGLQIIFSFFLGLMVATFIGVGVYTFHPPPFENLEEQIQELNAEEQSILRVGSSDERTEEDREALQDIFDRRAALSDQIDGMREPWGRSTSIVLIVLATFVMAVSLIRADQLPVISNGLLLGGVFTMIYGVGWIVATDTSISRFFVMTAALAITLGLGYVRFVRRRGDSGPSDELKAGAGAESDLDALDARVRKLEARIQQASEALGQTA